jgi:Glycosyl hydrolases family 16
MRRRTLLRGAGAVLLARSGDGATMPPDFAQGAELARDWTFGRTRSGATVRDMTALRDSFRFRYIYNGGQLDGLPSYWSKHRDYAENDPRSLHVFTDDALVLKGRVPPGGGIRPGGIESGMLRALLPVTPGMIVEMRAKLPRGLGAWPAFWLNPGVEYPDGHFSALPWPPEIDIFEFFVWQHRTRPMIMECNVQVDGHPEKYGNPHDTFSLFNRGEYDPGIDFSADFHTFALDWQHNLPTWYLDGRRIKQTVYDWGDAPPAHILVTNQIGMTLPGVDMTGMRDEGSGWDYTIDYLRVWQRRL